MSVKQIPAQLLDGDGNVINSGLVNWIDNGEKGKWDPGVDKIGLGSTFSGDDPTKVHVIQFNNKSVAALNAAVPARKPPSKPNGDEAPADDPPSPSDGDLPDNNEDVLPPIEGDDTPATPGAPHPPEIDDRSPTTPARPKKPGRQSAAPSGNQGPSSTGKPKDSDEHAEGPQDTASSLEDNKADKKVGEATLKYRTHPKGPEKTMPMEYTLQKGTEGRIGNKEARELRAAVAERRADAERRKEKWYDVRVEAEGEELNLGILRDRTRTGHPDDLDDEESISRSMSTRDIEAKLKESIEEQKRKLQKLKRLLWQIIDSIRFKGLDIQDFIRVFRLISGLMSVQGQIVKAIAIKDMVKKQEKYDEIRGELEELDGEAKGYTAKLRAKMSEQQGLQDDIQATMSVVRQAESFIDELRSYLKSIQDSTHGRQTNIASYRD